MARIALLEDVRACCRCEAYLPLGPRPVVQAGRAARLLIVGQAPGKRVHETGIPFNDPSGDRLRQWLGIDRDTFYDPQRVAIMPMGFCYPGRGRSGDLPPRPECAPAWHASLLAALPEIRLTLLLGQYAQRYYLPRWHGSLGANVAAYQQALAAGLFPLPHPSPRNRRWLRERPWFEAEVLARLREEVTAVLHKP